MWLTHFWSIVPFYTSWKHQKTQISMEILFLVNFFFIKIYEDNFKKIDNIY